MKEQKPNNSASPKPPTETEAARWVNQLLIRAIREQASDIQIEPGLKVQFRVDGEPHGVVASQREMESEIVARIKALFRIGAEKKQVPLSGSYAAIVDGRPVNFRVSISPTTYGETIVVQVLDPARPAGDGRYGKLWDIPGTPARTVSRAGYETWRALSKKLGSTRSGVSGHIA